jgi:hypothetical protein
MKTETGWHAKKPNNGKSYILKQQWAKHAASFSQRLRKRPTLAREFATTGFHKKRAWRVLVKIGCP